jgi:hypothetical protein
MGKAASRRDADSIVVFSPFGLGALDLAVADYVRKLGLAQGKGRMIESFLPLAIGRETQSAVTKQSRIRRDSSQRLIFRRSKDRRG